MKNTDILNRIMTLLNKKVELEKASLENGSEIEFDSLVVGADVFLVDGENKTPLEIGDHILADGTILTVTEVGKIGEIATPEAEVAEGEVEAEEMPKEEEEKMAEVPATLEEIVMAVLDAVQPKIDDLQAKIDAMSGVQSEMKETLSSKIVKKPLTHKPAEEKVSLANIKVAPNTSSTEARIFAMLSR